MQIVGRILLPVFQCDIKNGPDKFDFNQSITTGKEVRFTIDVNPDVKVAGKFNPVFNARIVMAGPEDGTYKKWLGIIEFSSKLRFNERRSFYYNSQDRTGVIYEANKNWELVTK